MGTARGYLGSAGTQTAALGFGGSSTSVLTNTEEYDGSAWTAGGNLPGVINYHGGAGTQTAGLSFGGKTGNTPSNCTNATNEYDGSAWTAGGGMGTGRWSKTTKS